MDELKHKKCIFVVDDDPRILELVGLRLSQKGYRVVVMESGEAVLAHIKIEKPGLVLLDIMMPNLNGFDVLKGIKAIDSNLPVCMMTAIWDDEEGKRCFEAGAYEYITKPIDFEYLETAILIKLLPNE